MTGKLNHFNHGGTENTERNRDTNSVFSVPPWLIAFHLLGLIET